MPTYLVHGFRWQRLNIRIHIILNNLEDAAPEWIIAPATSVTLLNSFYTQFDFLPLSNPPPVSHPPAIAANKVDVAEHEVGTTRTLKNAKKGSISNLRNFVRRPKSVGSGLNRAGKEVNGEGNGMQRPTTTPIPSARTRVRANEHAKPAKPPSFNDWSAVKLLEQHDPEDLAVVSQPYAYVADYMIEVPLGVSISEEMTKYETRKQEEEASLSMPGTPVTPGTPGTSSDPSNGSSGASSSTEKGGLHTPPLSAREFRRRSKRLGWFEKLRDELQKGEDIGWFVVHCGDEERSPPSVFEEDEDESDESEEGNKPLRSAGLMSAGLMNFFGRRNIPEEK
ncbi:uncharacterized protein RAG0_06450 [Rhynchosporium agropyri]|uniref:Developmental regulator protein n=1 Tax=Rhynchosporium agropyri TaxID=914238 RepID=A0A1E1KKF1_9HELO|nr:uncharacterized protein RAG0_06450 [Rhynchosporium agropyri]